MPRAIRVLAPAERQDQPIADTVLLDYSQRSATTFSVTGVRGHAYEITLPGPMRLCTDDVLELDGGQRIEIVAAPEPLIEVRADLATLARLAWQLGDRHLPVQILANRIRARREANVEALLAASGAKLTFIEAPFEPEGGAYTSSHGNAHEHRHHHAHHDH